MTEQSDSAACPQGRLRGARPEHSKRLIARLLRGYLHDQIGRLAVGFVCMGLVAVTTAAFTQLIKPIVDEIFLHQDSDLLLPIAGFTLAVFAIKGLASYGEAVLMNKVGLSIVAALQKQLYGRLVGADLAFYNETAPGSLISRFINDVTLLRTAVTQSVTGVGKDLLTAAALVAVMFYEDWLLASIAFFAFPLAIFPIVRIGRRMRKVSRRSQTEVGRLSSLLDETFQGIRHVKAYGMERYEEARAGAAIDEVYRLNLKAEQTRNLLHPIMEMLGGLAIVAVLLYGGYTVIDGDRTPGSFFAFIFALLLAYEPVKRLARLNSKLQEGLAAAERIFDILDRQPEIRDRNEAKPLRLDQGAIAFRDVSFGYHPGQSALTDLSLEIPGGSRVALVGSSGAGKSTILNLIPRFYDPDSGQVLIDGQNIRDVQLASLRKNIALVSQEIVLFDDTVGMNIAYGSPDATPEQITAAAAAAGATDFIEALPDGYDTLIGPRGAKLSGGQRQRIAIARALLKNAPILLLDEATSALDSETERAVQEALESLMKGRTTLVIAHRLSTVIGADQIVVLDAGRVVERGHHEALLAKGGSYAQLYRAQFAEASGNSDRS
ncbi:ABC transporter ATP-binding protein [Limibacillus halophilus]|uniref:ABC transporter ATP-binding protein n=1 Tax=Limibacillus halophilus TaxID=1579333 RepID=UPI001C8550DE|nr:ABC transporter ATP-binding protein [Limibacillus halophilus]